MVRGGTGSWTTQQSSYALRKGSVCFVRPFLPHSFSFDEGCDRIGVHCDLSPLIPGPERNVSLRLPYEICLSDRLLIQPFVQMPADHNWQQILRDLDAAMADDEPATRLRARSAVLRLLADMIAPDESAETRRNADEVALRLDEIIGHIRAHLNRSVTLQELSERGCMGIRQLTRMFTQRTGLAPMAYVRKLRMDRARALLISTTVLPTGAGASIDHDSANSTSADRSR